MHGLVRGVGSELACVRVRVCMRVDMRVRAVLERGRGGGPNWPNCTWQLSSTASKYQIAHVLVIRSCVIAFNAIWLVFFPEAHHNLRSCLWHMPGSSNAQH